MATFETLYNDITYTVKKAQRRFTEMKEENLSLKRQNEALREENESLKRRAGIMEEKMRLLVVTKIALNKEDNKKIKKQINDWVREIDECIRLLTEK